MSPTLYLKPTDQRPQQWLACWIGKGKYHLYLLMDDGAGGVVEWARNDLYAGDNWHAWMFTISCLRLTRRECSCLGRYWAERNANDYWNGFMLVSRRRKSLCLPVRRSAVRETAPLIRPQPFWSYKLNAIWKDMLERLPSDYAAREDIRVSEKYENHFPIWRPRVSEFESDFQVWLPAWKMAELLDEIDIAAEFSRCGTYKC